MSDWKSVKLGDVAKITMGQSPSSSTYNEFGYGLPFLQGCADFGPKYPIKKVYCSDPLKIAESNSILISVRAPVGALNIADTKYCIGRGLAGILGTSVDQAFLNYLISANIYKLESQSQGSTFAAINSGDLSNLSLEIPETNETQRTIANILSTVDDVIEMTEAVIEKYKAMKDGMMQDLFTRGIDTKTGKLRPTIEEAPELYKESELGWIPKEWDVVRWNEVCERVFVGIATSTTKYFVNTGVPLIRNQNILENKLDDSDLLFIRKDFADQNNSKAIKVGDILTIRTGYPGQSAVALEKHTGYHSFTTLISRLLTGYDSVFYCYYLNSEFGKRQISNLQGGGAQQNLNVGWFIQMYVPKPAFREQQMISESIECIEKMINGYVQESSKFNKLKTGLTSDLLTNKVSVNRLN